MNELHKQLQNIIVMKVGPHSDMSLLEIISSKKAEETIHAVHYWGYSGVFCQPKPVQEFCCNSAQAGVEPKLVLIETKSAYSSKSVGVVHEYSIDGINFTPFQAPVQLQGAHFSFVSRNLREVDGFSLDYYTVVGGKNDGKLLSQHIRYRVNKSFATAYIPGTLDADRNPTNKSIVWVADLVFPYAIWLRE